jgi:hypothetical protein
MTSAFRNTLLVLVLLGVLGSTMRRLSASNRWVPYTDTKGGYSVSLPGEPHEDSRMVKGPAGQVRVHFVATKAGDGSGPYGVSYVDMPPTVLDPRRAAQCMDGMCGSLPGEQLGRQSISVSGYPGREFRVRREQGVTTVRLFLAGMRLYQLMATSPTEEMGAGARAQFMDSFRLLAKG